MSEACSGTKPVISLAGTRPNFAAGGGAATTNTTANTSGSNPSAMPVASGGMWSKLIDADTLQNEIKNLQASVATDVKSISEFNSRGYKNSRVSYTMLGLMFAVITEYDGEVRFKKDALAARELFGRVSMNLKVATQQSFNESKARAGDLANLVRGESLDVPAGIEPKVKWSEKVANRPPLMTRLELAIEERLNKLMGDAGTFNKNTDAILHEAQLVAMISAAIQREGYDFADDKQYLEYAQTMQAGAMELIAGAKAKNYDGGRAGFDKMKKMCTDCHGSYR